MRNFPLRKNPRTESPPPPVCTNSPLPHFVPHLKSPPPHLSTNYNLVLCASQLRNPIHKVQSVSSCTRQWLQCLQTTQKTNVSQFFCKLGLWRCSLLWSLCVYNMYTTSKNEQIRVYL